MDKPFRFADRLQELMDLAGLNRSDVARICGINRSNITRYLNGEYEAKQDVVYTMATRLGVSPAWLMGYDVPMQEDSTPLRQNEKHALLIELFDTLPPASQDLIIAQLRGAAQARSARDDR